MEGNKLLDGLKEEMLSDIFSCVIGKISKIHDDKKVDVKPLYKIGGESLSIATNVPLMFIGNDDNIINVESKLGDLVVLLILDYDSDNVIISGEEKEVNTNRKHQISDALALPFSFTPFNTQKSHTSSVTIKTNGDVVIESDSIIKLGEDATEGVALGDSLKSYIDNHTHDYTWTNAGGSGTTDSPNGSSPNPSTKVKVI